MSAQQGDQQLFYKLIKKQRQQSSSSIATIDFGPGKSQLDGWADYFEDLATPSNNPLFDATYHQSRELQFLLLQQQEAHKCIDLDIGVDRSRVVRHILSLKNNKAADLYGITAEHLKLASPLISTVLSSLVNSIITSQKLPHQFKIGQVTPVLKKGKPAADPNSYRRITVNSILGKVAEKEMTQRTKLALASSHSALQFGFTENCSAANCALVVSEAIAEGLDQKRPLYVTMMDARKAFDVVWHSSVLVAMNEQGVTGPLWNLFVDMYGSVTSKIKLNGQLSRVIKERQGIRQGGLSSTECFKARANNVLGHLSQLPDSMHIGSISIASPTCADDTCLLSFTRIGAQTAINVAQDDANRERYEFSATKTKTILCNANFTAEEAEAILPLQLNGATLAYTEQETHLGQKQ